MYTVVDADTVEPYRGVMRLLRRELGLTAFGLNRLDLPPEYDEYPEHDETRTGHEEVYVWLSGGGTIRVDGDEIELAPGRVVRVTPESSRKIVAGADGISVLAIGAPAGARGKGWSAL